MNQHRKKELLRDARNLAATFIHRELHAESQDYIEEYTLEERLIVINELRHIADKLWTSAERINPDMEQPNER